MPRTWSSEESNDITCTECGSVYAVTIERFPLRDNDKFKCEICGATVREWNDTVVPTFSLKSAGKQPVK
jgi:hypothetical protein